jgi:hypothetical protein
VGRLCTRKKYLGIEKNAHELFWGILIFLLGESKSLRKGLIDSFFIVGSIKKEDRGEGEFRVFNKITLLIAATTNLSTFTTLFAMISSISSLKMFYFLRRLSLRSFRITNRYYLAKRVAFAFAFIALLNNFFFCRNKRFISASGNANSQNRFARKYCSQYSDISEIT